MITPISPATLFDSATPISCPCGETLRVNTSNDEGLHGGSVVSGGERGTAGIDRSCPRCGFTLNMEVWC